jgi:hypothetical protein
MAESIQQSSDDILEVEEGSLYPALQRMLIKGWVTAEWGVTSGNRLARTNTGVLRSAQNDKSKSRNRMGVMRCSALQKALSADSFPLRLRTGMARGG